MDSTYEHIVVGVGGIGAAAAYWLARRGSGDVLAGETRHHRTDPPRLARTGRAVRLPDALPAP